VAPSTAHVRSGHAAAHASSCRAWPGQAPAACPAAPRPGRSPPRCATPCAGQPRSSLSSAHSKIITRYSGNRGGHALYQTCGGRSSLFRATPRRGPAGQARRSKARHTHAGRRFGSQPRRTSRDATANRSAQSDGLYKAATRAQDWGLGGAAAPGRGPAGLASGRISIHDLTAAERALLPLPGAQM